IACVCPVSVPAWSPWFMSLSWRTISPHGKKPCRQLNITMVHHCLVDKVFEAVSHLKHDSNLLTPDILIVTNRKPLYSKCNKIKAFRPPQTSLCQAASFGKQLTSPVYLVGTVATFRNGTQTH